MNEPLLSLDDDFEELDEREVDEVIDSLEALTQNVTSESLRAILEEAATEVHRLFYDEEDESQAA